MIDSIVNKELIINNIKIKKFFSFHNSDKVFMISDIGTSILTDNETYKKIVKGVFDDNLMIKLINLGFAVIENGPSPYLYDEIKPTFFLISMTNVCNLHCKYCFNKFTNKKYISEKTIDKIVDYIDHYYHKYNLTSITIQPWGGEPLICFDKVKYLKRQLDNKKINFRICLETNGTLITENVAKDLQKYGIEVGLSIDGEEKIHNIQRPLINGDKSFDLVMKGMNNLDKYYQHPYGIISVITRNSMRDIKNTIELLRKHNISGCKFNLVKLSEDNAMSMSKNEIMKFANDLVDVFFAYDDILERNIIDRLDNLLNRPNNNICISNGCNGGRKMISFDMDGKIYPCEMTDYEEVCMGSIDKNEDLIDLISKNISNNLYFMPKDCTNKCQDCPFFYYCKGGCTSAILYKKKSMEGIDDNQCVFNKTLYTRLIEEILNDNKKIQEIMRKIYI